MALPRLRWIGGNLVPTQCIQFRPLIAHQHEVRTTITIHIRSKDVVGTGCFKIERDAFKRLLARVPRVAKPYAAAD